MKSTRNLPLTRRPFGSFESLEGRIAAASLSPYPITGPAETTTFQLQSSHCSVTTDDDDGIIAVLIAL
jgi:hypothetical protein